MFEGRSGTVRSVAAQLLFAVALLAVVCSPASAQFLLSASQQAASLGMQGQKLSYLDKNGSPGDRGLNCTEIIPGNGTRAGYMLSHGGLIPGSVFVSAGARTMRVNTDVFVDYTSGSIYFAEAVRRLDTIRVSYSYVKGQDGARSSVAVPGLGLTLGSTSLSLVYGMSAAASGGLDFSTYGLGMNSNVGKGGKLSGMFYMSTPSETNGNLQVDYSKMNGTPQARANADKAKSDHLITQDLSVKSGKTTLRASYQDVGSAFAGFQAMRLANSGNAAVLSQIGLLEKEKGIKRLGFGMTMAGAKNSALGVDWDQITDGSGAIQKTGVSYTEGRLKMSYGSQSVDKGFNLFGNLRDAGAAQWGRERGASRSNLALGLDLGKGGALGFTNDSFGDTSGSLNREAINLSTKTLSIALVERNASAGFRRLGDLADAEKTQLALDIRRQFNANATAAEVTQKDRDQIAADAGLTRQRMSVAGALTKQSSFMVNQVGIHDAAGSIDRTAVAMTAQNMTMNYLDQDISEAFTRLGSMSDFEKSQFGNEVGMHRTALGLNMNLSKTSSFAFSDLALSDKDGGMKRQSFGYKTKGFEAALNLADTEKGFGRARDVAGFSDADRNLMNTERGFRRMDFTGKLTSVRGLALEAYDYGAHNSSDLLSRDIHRYNLNWVANKLTTINFLSEGNSYDQNGKTIDGRAHEVLTLDSRLKKNMKFSFLRDMLAVTAGGTAAAPVTTNFMHFETDRGLARNLLAEARMIDYGNGHHEDTYQFDGNYRANKALNLRFNNTTIDRGADPSLDTNMLLWNWQMNRAVAFTGTYADTATNNHQDVTSQSYTLAAPISRTLSLAGTYTEVDVESKAPKMVKDLALSNSKAFDALGVKQMTVTAKYSSTTDQQTLQSEAVGGRVQGYVGKSQVALEYAGSSKTQTTSAFTRSLSFISDRSAKLPLRFDMLYKARNMNGSDVQLVRLYNIGYRLDRLTNLTYTYASLPEAANQVIQPLRSSGLTLSRTLTKRLTFSQNYSTNYNLAQNTKTNRLSSAISGRLDSLSALEAGYSVDINTANGANTNAHTIRLSFDRQLNTDRYLSVNTLYTRDRVGLREDLRVNVDMKSRF